LKKKSRESPIKKELSEYSRKALDHFFNPRNVGEIQDASVVETVENPQCGDVIKLYLKILDSKIADAKMKAFGCTAVIASASALTEYIKGKSLDEARKITNEEVVEYLGGLPAAKVRCSVIISDLLKKAVDKYERD